MFVANRTPLHATIPWPTSSRAFSFVDTPSRRSCFRSPLDIQLSSFSRIKTRIASTSTYLQAVEENARGLTPRRFTDVPSIVEHELGCLVDLALNATASCESRYLRLLHSVDDTVELAALNRQWMVEARDDGFVIPLDRHRDMISVSPSASVDDDSAPAPPWSRGASLRPPRPTRRRGRQRSDRSDLGRCRSCPHPCRQMTEAPSHRRRRPASSCRSPPPTARSLARSESTVQRCDYTAIGSNTNAYLIKQYTGQMKHDLQS